MSPSASPARALQSVFHIYPGEGAAAAWLTLYSVAALGFLYTVGLTASSALFLSGLPPSAVPFTFILPAVVVAPTIVAYNRLAARVPHTRLVVGSTLLMIGGMALFRALFETPYGDGFPVLAGFFVFNDVVAALTYLQFWTFASQTFNARQGKRLFGFIAGAGTLTTIIAGAILGAVGDELDPKNLLFVLIAGLACCLAAAWGLGRRQPAGEPAPAASDAPAASLLDDLRALAQSPLLRLIAGLVALVTIVTNIAEYQLYIGLQTAFADNGSQMVAFLGALDFWTGLAGLVVQLVIVHRVMGRFGVVAALLVLPVALGISSGLVLLTGGTLWAITLLKASDSTFNPTIDDTARKVLYLPMPADLGRQAQEFLEGVGTPILYGILGLVFLAMDRVPAWGLAQWSIVALGLIVIWLLLLRQAPARYQRALAENMRKRRLSLDGAALDLSDKTTVEVLAAALRHPDELQVLHALQLIRVAPAAWDPHVAPLLDHPSPDVRLLALRHLGRPGNTAYTQRLAALLDTPSDMLRAAAIEGWCAVQGQAAIARATAWLDAPSPAIRAAAMVGLIKYGGLDGILQAAIPLKEMLASRDPAQRAEGAAVLAKLGVATFFQPLIPLFDDPSPAVRLSAIRAAGVLRVPELAPLLVRTLEDKPTAGLAAAALAQYGTGIEPLLAQTLASPDRSRDARIHVARILQHVGTREAGAVLLAQIEVADDRVRLAVYRALARLQADGAVAIPRETLREAIDHELRAAYGVYTRRASLAAMPRDPLLGDALDARLGHALDRLFALLALLYPTSAITTIRQTLEGPSSDARAQAVELLDTLLAQDIKDGLLPLLEAPPEQVVAIAHRRFGLSTDSPGIVLTDLARGEDVWLRACALFRIAQQPELELAQVMDEALSADDELVRETAAQGYRSLVAAHDGAARVR